jgi:hypothetical protein
MDPNSPMTNAECVAAIVALVAAVRTMVPQINGLFVLVLATAVGTGLAFLTGDATMAWRLEAQRGILFGLAAVGGVTAADRHAVKSGESAARVITRAAQRGFLSVEVIVVACAAALLALFVVAVIVEGCAGGPRCDVIQLQGCQLFTLERPNDGGRMQVGRVELEEAAERTAARLAAQDAGH